jgi:glycosyltransferase involved in cell wall biosynthesis
MISEESNRVPNVSVVMNCRNSAKFLREAIESVFFQTYTDWEIIFFDNQSTDASAQIAKSFDSRLRYFLSPLPLSLGEARNAALEQCRGNYIAFLDCDDLWMPHKLAEQMAIFEKHPEVSFVHSNYISFYLDGREIKTESSETRLSQPFERYLERYSIGIATVVMKSSLLRQMEEYFDPAFSLVEDFDFFMRALFPDTWVYYDGRELVKYRVHESNLSTVLRAGWGDEFDATYKKFQRLVADFDRRFPVGAKSLRGKAAYFKARNFIDAGDGAGARAALSPVKFESPKMFFLYIVTFFPTQTWRALYAVFLRLRSLFSQV